MKFRDAAAILYPQLSDEKLDALDANRCNCSRYETCAFCKTEAAKDGIAEPDAAVEAYTRTMEPKREDEC
jgi:hypothetical protein